MAIACVGVILALLPVTIYIRSGIGSQLQHQFDTMIPIIPLHLLTAIVGAAITITALLFFIKSWRTYVEQQAFHRPSPPTVSSPPPIGERTPIHVREPVIEGSSKEVEALERELNEIIMRGVDVKTTQPTIKPTEMVATTRELSKETKIGINIVVVVKGVDEVCRACGSVNPLGAKVCSECGEKLYIPKPGEPSCPVCGAPLSDAQQIGENYVCQVCFSELRLEKSLS